MLYAVSGTSDWDGMDMEGESRSVEDSWQACRDRCATTTNCEYFTFWVNDGGCHLQDVNAVLRESLVDWEADTIHGHKDATNLCSYYNGKQKSEIAQQIIIKSFKGVCMDSDDLKFEKKRGKYRCTTFTLLV